MLDTFMLGVGVFVFIILIAMLLLLINTSLIKIVKFIIAIYVLGFNVTYFFAGINDILTIFRSADNSDIIPFAIKIGSLLVFDLIALLIVAGPKQLILYFRESKEGVEMAQQAENK